MEMNMAKDFQTMVDFIYKPAGHWTGYLHNNCDTCPQKLFEQLELDERCQVLDLETLVIETLQIVVIPLESMIFAATVASIYMEVPDPLQMIEILDNRTKN